MHSVSGVAHAVEPTVDEADTYKRVAKAPTSSAALKQPKKFVESMPHVAALSEVDHLQVRAIEGQGVADIHTHSSDDRSVRLDYPKESVRPTTPSMKARAVQDDSNLLRKVLAIPPIKTEYKPNSTVLKRLPLYLRPEFVEKVEPAGRDPADYSKIAAITVGSKKVFDKGIGGCAPIIT